MKISDAKNILNENKGKHLYDVIVPSTGEKIPFRPMTVGHHKSIAKMAINDESNFDKFLCALILELSAEQVNLAKITELDKMAILYQIKQHNSTESLKINLTCPEPECNMDFIVTPKDSDVIKTDVTLNYIKILNIDDIDFEIEIGMPSVEDNMYYADFCDVRANKFEKDDEENLTKLGIFIASYEMYLMCVRSIKIDGQDIEDFATSTIEDRISFIEDLSEGLIVVKEISDFMNEKHKEYGYHVSCPKCNYKFDNLFTPESFFF